MFTILAASFVVVCTVFSMAVAVYVVRFERRKAAEVILAAEPLLPEWIGQRRMDVPKKYPAIRTRSTKVMR